LLLCKLRFSEASGRVLAPRRLGRPPADRLSVSVQRLGACYRASLAVRAWPVTLHSCSQKRVSPCSLVHVF
jgi:hypothetical protein